MLFEHRNKYYMVTKFHTYMQSSDCLYIYIYSLLCVVYFWDMTIMALHNFLPFVALSKVCLLFSPNPCSTNQKKLVK